MSHSVPHAALHPRLRAAWAHCETIRADLLALLEVIPAERWFAASAAGQWTIAELVDHLIRSEIGTSKMVRKMIRGDFRGLWPPDGVPINDSSLAVYPYGPLVAPAVLEPAAVESAKAVSDLGSAHARFLEELLRLGDGDPDALAAPDPATSEWFTLGGWVRLQALHEAHHVERIRELVR